VNHIRNSGLMIIFLSAFLTAQDRMPESTAAWNEAGTPGPNRAALARGLNSAALGGLGAVSDVPNFERQDQFGQRGTDGQSLFSGVADFRVGLAPSGKGSTEVVKYAALRAFGLAYRTSDASESNTRDSFSNISFHGQLRSSIATRIPIALSPQTSGSGTLAQPTPSKHKYWTKRRIVVLAIGLGVAGAGASLWIHGKDLPNANYNPSACQASFNSGPIPYDPNACNETLPSSSKKAGLWLMIGGGALTGASFVPGL